MSDAPDQPSSGSSPVQPAGEAAGDPTTPKPPPPTQAHQPVPAAPSSAPDAPGTPGTPQDRDPAPPASAPPYGQSGPVSPGAPGPAAGPAWGQPGAAPATTPPSPAWGPAPAPGAFGPGPAPGAYGPGPGGPFPTRPRTGFSPAATLVGSAVTLVLGAVVAAVLLGMSGAAGDYLDNDRSLIGAASLALLAAPVGLLVGWDEFDLSGFGVVLFGGFLYSELADDSVLPGVLAAAVAGLIVGAVIGLARWLTRAPSALVSLSAAVLLAGVATNLGPGPAGARMRGGFIEGTALPLLTMVAVTGLAIVLAIALRDPSGPSASSPAGGAAAPGPRVIVGFALSGLAAGIYGAYLVGTWGYYEGPQISSLVLTLVFASVAVGGVVRGSGPVGPPAAALGAVVVSVVNDAALLNDWRQGEGQIALGMLFVVTVLIAHLLRRALAPRSSPPVGSF